MLHLFLASLLATAAAPPPSNDDDDNKPARQQSAQQPRADQAEADDDDEEKAQPTTPVVITARRLDAARNQIDAGLGSTVYSLNNDTIEDRPSGESGSIADILTQSPGVNVTSDALTIRGSKDVQVRINNVIIPESISDPADRLSARLAETTRVMTGTLPAQFGYVPAGVISLTTKNGLYNHGGEVEFYGGTDGYLEPAFEWEGSALDTSLFGSASLESDRTDVADPFGNQTHDHRREIGGMAFADHILGSNDRISFVLGGDDELHRFGRTALPSGTQESSEGYGVGTFQHSAGDLTVQASLFAGEGTDNSNFTEHTREHRSTLGTQVDASYELGTAHVLKAGLLASHSRTDELDLGGIGFAEDRNSLGLFAQDEWKLSSALTINPGVRFEWLKGLGHPAKIEPRASLVFIVSKGLTAHVGYARYATVPRLGEDKGTTALPDQRDDYFDGGMQYKTGPLTLGVDAYLRRTRNLLDEYGAIGSAVAQSFAFQRARFRGLEISATYSTHALSAWINVALSRALGRSLIENTAIFAPQTLAAASNWIPLPSDRPVDASGGVTWRSGKLALSAIIQGSSGAVRAPTLAEPDGRRASAYATVGLSVVYHGGTAKSRRDFRVDITNLTDARYRVSEASSLNGGWTRWGRGRAITLGVEQGF